MMDKKTSNTSIERDALQLNYNLADGHCRLTPTLSMFNALKRTIYDFFDGKLASQTDCELEFYNEYKSTFRLSKSRNVLYSYSVSSLAYTVGLSASKFPTQFVYQNPFFDNIRDIIIRCGHHIDDVLEAELFGNFEKFVPENGVLWLTLPNNPTGMIVGMEEIANCASICERRNCLLVCDLSFRAFSPKLRNIDFRQIFEEFKLLKWIILEDTGKMLPTADLKVGMLESSKNLFERLKVINEEHLLNVSPVIFLAIARVLREFDLEGYLDSTVRKNRELITGLSIWKHYDGDIVGNGEVPFLWIRGKGEFGTILTKKLNDFGVGVLPGTRFFPGNSPHGPRHMRIALSRDSSLMVSAASHIGAMLALK